jgi:Thioredoxin.
MAETDTERTLETMKPNPVWDADSWSDVVAVFSDDNLTVRVWGGDWCNDCRRQLPDFAAAMSAADILGEQVHEYPVDKNAHGEKHGPRVEEYGINRIPTVVVERENEEVARFVETESVPIAVSLAGQLTE